MNTCYCRGHYSSSIICPTTDVCWIRRDYEKETPVKIAEAALSKFRKVMRHSLIRGFCKEVKLTNLTYGDDFLISMRISDLALQQYNSVG